MEQTNSKKKDILLLVCRIVVGGMFVFAGYVKVVDMAETISMFSLMGVPAVPTYLVSYGELLGGLALLIGLWTRLVASLLAIIMIGAVYYSTVSMGIMGAIVPIIFLVLLGILKQKGAGKYKLFK